MGLGKLTVCILSSPAVLLMLLTQPLDPITKQKRVDKPCQTFRDSLERPRSQRQLKSTTTAQVGMVDPQSMTQ